MVKNPNTSDGKYYYGQDNPADQARVLIGGLRGQVHNVANGLKLNVENCNLLLNMLESLAIEYMPKEWKEE